MNIKGKNDVRNLVELVEVMKNRTIIIGGRKSKKPVFLYLIED